MLARALAREDVELCKHYVLFHALLRGKTDRLEAMKRNEIFK